MYVRDIVIKSKATYTMQHLTVYKLYIPYIAFVLLEKKFYRLFLQTSL